MIGIQLISHGKMSEGMLDSVDMIIGDTEKVVFNELERAQDIEEFKNIVLETTKSLQSEDGVLIFVDMFGASPYNVSMLNSRDMEGEKYKIISGVNLPLLIEAITMRSSMEIDDLYGHLLDMRKNSIIGWEN